MLKIVKFIFFYCLLLINFNSLAYTIEIKASDIVHVEKENTKNEEIRLKLWLVSSDNEENRLMTMYFKNKKLFDENYTKDSEGNIRINNIGLSVDSDTSKSVYSYKIKDDVKIPDKIYLLLISLISLILVLISFLYTGKKYLYNHEK